MKDTVTSRKYAKALFAQAQASKQIRACQQGLEEFTRVIHARESLRSILMQPFIGSLEKQKLIRATMGEYATPLLERFMNLLVKRNRFDLLPVIIQQFQEEVDQSQNMQAVHVRVAYPLNEGQRKTFQAELEKWLDSKVRMDVVVEPELIGGVVVQFKDRELDQSLRTQLRRMKDELSK